MDIDEDDQPKLSEEGEKELTRLWRTWKTVIEMLVDRVCGDVVKLLCA
jgi:RNA polymerase Rpb5, N-terminal domain